VETAMTVSFGSTFSFPSKKRWTGGGLETLESYGYTMDKAGLIGRIDQVDSSYWTYGYDARYRLTSAVRHNAADTIKAN
jgi:hypothetical protein